MRFVQLAKANKVHNTHFRCALEPSEVLWTGGFMKFILIESESNSLKHVILDFKTTSRCCWYSDFICYAVEYTLQMGSRLPSELTQIVLIDLFVYLFLYYGHALCFKRDSDYLVCTSL